MRLAHSDPAAVVPSGLTMARILVVDDDPSLRATLERILERAGHDVLQAEDGIEGLRVYQAERPDLTVVDMLMPNMDGIEMITRLQRLDENARVICISGGGPTENYGPLVVMEVLGVRAVLTKPFTSEEVVSTVQNILK